MLADDSDSGKAILLDHINVTIGFEADGVGHAPDDLDAPSAEFGECLEELIAGIGTVGEEESGSD